MSIEKVKAYFKTFGMEDKILEFPVSSATVALAAEALGTAPARIAKSLSFKKGEGCILVVMAGDARLDNRKFKEKFSMKATMLSPEEALACTGHAVGGVCPFALPVDVEVYLDISLKRFETVFPAAGSSNSAIELDCESLFRYARAKEWVDLCKDWQGEGVQ